MSDAYHKRLAQIKAVYPRAYEQWTEAEELRLLALLHDGRSVLEIAGILQRQPSAISSRLRKLNLFQTNTMVGVPQNNLISDGMVSERPQLSAIQPPAIVEFSEPPITISFSFEWHLVMASANMPYIFPQPMTSFMTARYKWPAVYRWLVVPSKEVPPVMYIGSTKKLCPDRLDGYIHPQSSSTNQRLNIMLRGYKTAGYSIRLEILHNGKTGIDDRSGNATYSFQTQTHRIVIEELLIAYYKQQGVTLLNA